MLLLDVGNGLKYFEGLFVCYDQEDIKLLEIYRVRLKIVGLGQISSLPVLAEPIIVTKLNFFNHPIPSKLNL